MTFKTVSSLRMEAVMATLNGLPLAISPDNSRTSWPRGWHRRSQRGRGRSGTPSVSCRSATRCGRGGTGDESAAPLAEAMTEPARS